MQYVKQERYYQARTDAERQAALAATLNRKLADAQCALDLEKQFTKQQILEKYLDIAFFGENSYGIATAAQTYFGVPVSKLTVPEAALLVGLVRAPSTYDPFTNPAAARQRRNAVLQNMAEVGDLSPVDAQRYAAQPVHLATTSPPPTRQGCAYANPAVLNAGFFCDYAVGWLLQHGVSQHQLYTGGLRVVTTLDARLQTSGQRAVWSHGLRSNSDYVLVMPSVDPRTGDVTTMITSRKYGVSGRGVSSDPLFTAAYAGAGSTYKYFSAVAALTAGAPTTMSLTTPGNTYTTRNCRSGAYTVHNAGSYADTLPLSSALPQSSNTYFVALEDQFFGCHLKPIVDTALSLGMDRLRQPLNSSAAGSIAQEVAASEEPTFTLGQEPTSVLQLTSAFSAAVNDGTYCPPVPITSVTDASGSPVTITRPACHRAMSRYVARTVVSLMRADTHNGTAAQYFRSWYAAGHSDVAAKTGTDNDASDTGNSALWFVGMTPHLVSTAALVDPANPKRTIHDLPGLPDSFVAQDVFGAYASTYWQAAYGPALAAQRWAWPSPKDADGSTPVPSVIGATLGAATATLRGAGFAVAQYPQSCGSWLPAGTVAYQQPPTASHGATVTICLSSGNGYSITGVPGTPLRRSGPPVIAPRNPSRPGGPAPAPAPTRHHRHPGH
jgi:membrane peptidoglycan carboxypeptidase